jgi:hypothetical protein
MHAVLAKTIERQPPKGADLKTVISACITAHWAFRLASDVTRQLSLVKLRPLGRTARYQSLRTKEASDSDGLLETVWPSARKRSRAYPVVPIL